MLEREKIRAEEEKLKHKEADRVLEEERLKSERALEEERLKLEREKLKSNEAIEMEKLRLKREELQKEPSETTTPGKIKMPPFDEEKDSFDSYISRFENIAGMRKWKKEEWATQLSLLLSGKALDTFFSLSDTQQKNYETVKEALMRKYQLTEEEFRKGFLESGIEKGETIQQFMARLERLFTRWVETSKVKKDYNGLKNLLIREGFYQRCDRNLAAYLREKDQGSLEEIVVSAQKYMDAHGGNWGQTEDQKNTNKYGSMVTVNRTQQTDNLYCMICKKTGHTEDKCWFKDKDGGSEQKCFLCGSSDHLIKDCKKEKQTIGSASVVNDRSSKDIQEQYSKLSPKDLGKRLRVPMAKGTVNGHPAMVMRDTGFGNVAVRSKFVNRQDYVDEYEDVLLLDNTKRRFQKAVVELNTAHFTGVVKALVVDTLVVDCIIGNIEELQDSSNHWYTDEITSVLCAAAIILQPQTTPLKKPRTAGLTHQISQRGNTSRQKKQENNEDTEREMHTKISENYSIQTNNNQIIQRQAVDAVKGHRKTQRQEKRCKTGESVGHQTTEKPNAKTIAVIHKNIEASLKQETQQPKEDVERMYQKTGEIKHLHTKLCRNTSKYGEAKSQIPRMGTQRWKKETSFKQIQPRNQMDYVDDSVVIGASLMPSIFHRRDMKGITNRHRMKVENNKGGNHQD